MYGGSDNSMVRWISTSPNEKLISEFIYQRLNVLCSSAGIRKPLFVDVGANHGYFGLLAAAMGCRVVAFEPQPSCWGRITAAVLLNGFQSYFKLIKQPVSDTKVEVVIRDRGSCSGGFSLRDASAEQAQFER